MATDLDSIKELVRNVKVRNGEFVEYRSPEKLRSEEFEEDNFRRQEIELIEEKKFVALLLTTLS